MKLHPDTQTPGQHSASGFTDRGELLSIRTMPGARAHARTGPGWWEQCSHQSRYPTPTRARGGAQLVALRPAPCPCWPAPGNARPVAVLACAPCP